MVRKFPCCGDCGTKLTHVNSGTKSPEGYQIRNYHCSSCNKSVVRINQQVEVKNEKKFYEYMYDFTFNFIRRK